MSELGDSVPEHIFWDREAERERLVDALGRGERVLVVYGARRAGKSAFLRHLSEHLPDTCLGIYLDASLAGSWASAAPILQIAGEVGRVARERGGARVPPPDAAAFERDPLTAWRDYLSHLQEQLDGRQPVLLVDNADRASADWLSVLLQANTPLVLTAQSRLELESRLAPLDISPITVVLGPLESEAAEGLIKSLISPRMQIDPWGVRRIMEASSNHPHYIYLLCRFLMERPQTAPFTPSDVEDAIAALIERPLTEFVTLWESASSDERAVLAAFGALIGHGGIATPYDIQKVYERNGLYASAGEIYAAMESLAERGVLEKMGTNSYRFTVELFRLWIHRHHPPDKVLGNATWSLSRWGSGSTLRRVMGRYRILWMSAGALMLVVLVLLSQPAFRRVSSRTPHPPTFTAPATTLSLATPVPTAFPVIASPTPTPTPTIILPGYDLAFMSRRDQDAPWQIYVMNSRTGERLRLTDTNSNERTPKWSPDGTRLLFVSDRDGNREVYVMDLEARMEGREALVNLSRNKAPDWQPAWSPDGRRVAFSSYRDGNWEIYLMDSDGSNPVRLTEHPASDFSPAWSPDGRQVLFVSRRHGDADLFVIDLDSGERTQLTHSELDEYEPAWSPDGRWIAFVTQIGDQSDVFVMRADGSNPANLTNSSYANDFQPAWSADGKWIYFVSYTMADGDHELYKMHPDGSQVIRVTDDNDDDLAPSVRPEGSSSGQLTP